MSNPITPHHLQSHRPHPTQTHGGTTTTTMNSSSGNSNKARQLSHLNAQLALLQAHLSDTENLVSVTKVQAECLRWMAGYSASLFMASSKVLGEESLKAAGLGGAGSTAAGAGSGAGNSGAGGMNGSGSAGSQAQPAGNGDAASVTGGVPQREAARRGNSSEDDEEEDD